MSTKLDVKHKALADRYLVHLNGARAAREAGFSNGRGRQTAYEILSREDVQSYIERESKRLEQVSRARAFRVYDELAIVSHSDIADFVIGKSGDVRLRPGVPAEAWRAVQSIEYSIDAKGKKSGVKIRLWPKTEALRMEGQTLAMFTDVVQVHQRTLEDALDEIETGGEGAERATA